MKNISAMKVAFLSAALFVTNSVSADNAKAQEPTIQASPAETPAYTAYLQQIETTLQPQSGSVNLDEANVRLDLGNGYYFLDPVDSRKVLVDAYGNPPEAMDGVLGMIFQSDASFVDPKAWAAVLTYHPTGYVSDEDAHAIDYGEVLDSLRDATVKQSKVDVERGYPAMNLIGWAENPSYDANRHSLVWARNYKVGGASENLLNYDVRILGRYGVFSMNMISSMSQLTEVKAGASALARTAVFDAGHRYTDFNATTDDKAEFGLAGLVAGGAGLAVAKKVGLIGIILAFAKKGFVLILLPLIFLWRRVAGWLGIGKVEEWDFDDDDTGDEPQPQ